PPAPGGARLPRRPGPLRGRGHLPAMRRRILWLGKMRALGIAIFALAVTGATLAGSGLVVAPHVDPPGTPVFHDHVLAAYRFPIFLMRLQQVLDRGPKLTVLSPLVADVALLVMGLLVMGWPRLPRPTRRPAAFVALPHLSNALWSAPLLLGPPRT